MWANCVATFAALLIAGTVQAATVYDCAMKGRNKTPHVAPAIRLTVDEASGRATVWDAVIAKRHPGPIPARLTRRGGNSVQFDWEVEVEYKKNRTSQADFKLILNTGTGKASIRAHVPGNFEEASGKGTCRVSGV